MRRIIAPAIAGLALTAAGVAVASDRDRCGAVAAENWMSAGDVASMLAEQAYEVRELERDDGCWEAYVVDADGRRLELYVHPETGEIVKIEADS